MADIVPAFEQTDRQGFTAHYNGTVGTTSALVPSVAVGHISTCLIRNPISNPDGYILYLALDGQSTYLTLNRGEYIQWTPNNTLGGATITQVRLLGSQAAVNFETVMNFEV